MAIEELKRVLGMERVVWIDDVFATSPKELAAMVVDYPAAARGFESVRKAVEAPAAFRSQEDVEADLEQAIADLLLEDRFRLRDAVFAVEGVEKRFRAGELSRASVRAACEALSVAGADRWTFDVARERLAVPDDGGPATVGYVVDLNETDGDDRSGLDLLDLIVPRPTTAAAFILTHTADRATEAAREAELSAQRGEGAAGSFTVVTKDRLGDTVEEAAAGLAVGFKRAGLRRVLEEVLGAARPKFVEAYDHARAGLLAIRPEALEAYVFERGALEGISVMHVVERAVASVTSERMRRFFAVDPAVRAAVRKLRALGSTKLDVEPAIPAEELGSMMQAEAWDDDETVNGSLSPLSCGDVFELDAQEEATRTLSRRFLLLGQPCDIALRPDGGRNDETAMLVLLREANGSSATGTRRVPLRFPVQDRRWFCDLRQVATASLPVLDLATFRTDGRVRLDVGHERAADLLDGQLAVYARRVAASDLALADGAVEAPDGFVREGLLLTSSTARCFAPIRLGVLKAEAAVTGNPPMPQRPRRVTWHLRRCGRVRADHAAAVLEDILHNMGRAAFDLDYSVPRAAPAPVETSSAGGPERAGSGAVPDGPHEAAPDRR